MKKKKKKEKKRKKKHTHVYKYHWSPLGRINASGIEWLGWQGRIAWLCAI